jgi:ABC-type dipeptide/oligopeptide/nickel transport system permease component
MHRYIVSRLLLVIPTLLGAAALVFILMRLIPGDICLVRLGSGGTGFFDAGARRLPRRDRHRQAVDRCSSPVRLGDWRAAISAPRCGRESR